MPGGRSSYVGLGAAPRCKRRGLLRLSSGVKQTALGRSGISAFKKEGDGATPLGSFAARMVLYRADRVARPVTSLPVQAIGAQDGWSDDPADPSYNRMVRLPRRGGAESLKRDDHLYDLVLVLDHNERPRIRGRGSAIFLHMARPGYTPTEGCIAVSAADFRALLREIRPGSRIVIGR